MQGPSRHVAGGALSARRQGRGGGAAGSLAATPGNIQCVSDSCTTRPLTLRKVKGARVCAKSALSSASPAPPGVLGSSQYIDFADDALWPV